MDEYPYLPVIERVEIVVAEDAVRATEEQAPLITDKHGEWYAMRFESVPFSRNAIARLRLAIPVGGLPRAKLDELNASYGVRQ